MNLSRKKLGLFLTVTVLATVLALSPVMYVLAQSGTTFTISSGIYPGAPSYTVWNDTSTNLIHAKNSFGNQPSWSGSTNASDVAEEALTNGVSVEFSEGTYVFDVAVPLKAYNKVSGAGSATVFKPSGNNGIFSLVATLSEATPITLSNFAINDEDTVTSTAYALDLYGCGSSFISDITITNYAKGIKIRGETGRGAQNNFWGRIIMNEVRGIGFDVEGQYINDNRYSQIYIYGKPDNYFADALWKVNSTASPGRDGSQFSDITILSGGHQKYGMLLAGAGSSFFSNIVIDQTGNDANGVGLKMVKSGSVYPAYNWFNNLYVNAYAGRGISIEGDVSGYATRLHFTNFEVNSATQDGVYLYYVQSADFNGMVRDNTLNGYNLQFSDGVDIQGTVISNGQFGINRDYGSNNKFHDIAFHSNSAGVYDYSLGSDNTISDCKGYVTENSGIAIVSAGNTSLAVLHGLAGNPEPDGSGNFGSILITSYGNDNDEIQARVGSVNATAFVIYLSATPGTEQSFFWIATFKP